MTKELSKMNFGRSSGNIPTHDCYVYQGEADVVRILTDLASLLAGKGEEIVTVDSAPGSLEVAGAYDIIDTLTRVVFALQKGGLKVRALHPELPSQLDRRAPTRVKQPKSAANDLAGEIHQRQVDSAYPDEIEGNELDRQLWPLPCPTSAGDGAIAAMLRQQLGYSIRRGTRMTIAVDGACPGNQSAEQRRAACGVSTPTHSWAWPIGSESNNRAEMLAMLGGLIHARAQRVQELTIECDSLNTVKGMTEWRAGWERRRFKEVQNLDLWHRLFRMHDECVSLGMTIAYQHVKGHAGHAGNEAANALAQQVAASQQARIQQS